MKKTLLFTSLVALGFIGCGTKIEQFSLQGALNDPKAKEVLAQDVELSYGQKGEQGKGFVVTTSKRTTLAGKGGVEQACRWALYSAIKQFQQDARKQGSTKVINVVSNWKHKVPQNQEMYECAVGNMLVGVALKGEVLK